jgi:hypothetical protein
MDTPLRLPRFATDLSRLRFVELLASIYEDRCAFESSEQELTPEQAVGLRRLGYMCNNLESPFHADTPPSPKAQRRHRIHFGVGTAPACLDEASRIELERACFVCDQATDWAFDWRLEILSDPRSDTAL